MPSDLTRVRTADAGTPQTEQIAVACCVCGRVCEQGLWRNPDTDPGPRVSHTYCPLCQIKAVALLYSGEGCLGSYTTSGQDGHAHESRENTRWDIG